MVTALAACAPPPESSGAPPAIEASTSDAAKPWTSLAPNDAEDDFRFVVVTDRTCCHRPGVFEGAMPKINQLEPAFVVSVGDLIEGYTENQGRLDAEWDEMEGFIAKLETPFFYTAGNHDMSNAVMAETWRSRFGPTFYHFEYKGVLFLVLNSELFGMVGQPDVPLPGPWTQAEQMAYIEQVLTDKYDARWTIVLLHQPLWDTAEIDEDWLKVEELLGSRNYTVFAGHHHRYNLARRHDRNYITLATTGGGSPLRGTIFGEFDHVAWVTMTERGPRIANLTLDGILDENVANDATRTVIDALAGLFTVEPLPSEGEVFSEGTVRVTMTNPAASEVRVRPLEPRTEGYTVAGLEPVVLAPGETRALELSLAAEDPTPFRSIGAGVLEWTVTAEADGRLLQYTASTPVMPVTTHRIPTATGVVVDGNLDEWGELPFVVDRQGDIAAPQTDPADISFRFGVRADEAGVYVAVDVTDDALELGPERLAREQDAIAIAIDARSAERRAETKSISAALFDGTLAAITVTFLTPEEAPARDELLGFLEKGDAALTRSVVRTDEGYRAELLVPSAVLDAQAGVPWRDLRIELRAYDFDPGEHGETILHWQPYRFGDAPLAGTGAFTRG
jgi:hypothetical protein